MDDIQKQIDNSLEYLNYHITQLCEKGDINLYPFGTIGVGKVIKQSGNFIICRQFNGKLFSREEYFENKEHSKMVYNGLYCKPYFGNKELYKKLNK